MWNPPVDLGYSSDTVTSSAIPNNGYSNNNNGPPWRYSNAYDNYVVNAAFESASQPAEQQRPKSPVQKILRYRLDDPDLTSVNDTRYRPYQYHNRGKKNTFQNQQRRASLGPDEPRSRPPSPVSQLDNEPESILREPEPRPVLPVHEMEFAKRCRDLGVTFYPYRLKETVDGKLLEKMAIEIWYGTKSSKVYGDGCVDAVRAREVAFLEGIRRLEFLFGKPGTSEGGFWTNQDWPCDLPASIGKPGASEGGFWSNQDKPRNLPGENMIPNPLYEFQWATPPPPLPQFAPPSKPPLPRCPPPLTERLLRNPPQPQPLPPGVNYAEKIHGPVAEPQSSWAAMSSHGFFNPGGIRERSVVSPRKANPLLVEKQKEFQQFWDSPDLKRKEETECGPNETLFLEKMEEFGLFFKCIELPPQVVYKPARVQYFAFELQFWKWDTAYQEKVVGGYSPFVGLARESAFSIALEKIKGAFNQRFNDSPVFTDNQDKQEFSPFKSTRLTPRTGEDKFPKRLAVGRGRGRILDFHR